MIEDVAVSVSSHVPLLVRYGLVVKKEKQALTIRYLSAERVLSIHSSDEPSTPPSVVQAPPPVIGWEYDLRRVSPGDAAKVFGHEVLWAGRTVSGLYLQKVRLQQLTSVLLPSYQTYSSRLGLSLHYGGHKQWLEIRESTSPEPGYGFGSVAASPPLGSASLLCGPCPRSGSRSGRRQRRRSLWLAYLRKGDLFVAIRSPSRTLVVKSARTLVPITSP